MIGANEIAVMVKNLSNTSSDISFDLGLELTLGVAEAGPSWTSDCVDMVASTCTAYCDDTPPIADTALCMPWYPGETDSSCAGVDLSVGVPCDDSIPVCNHGNTTAPSGVRLVHFPGNSQQYPLCSPDQTHPQMEECFTSEEIPPGECINVTDCDGLNGNREIMINPEGDDEIEECSCRNNWSLYSGGTCGPPVCSGGTSVATLQTRPVDIIFIIDNSSSMSGEISQVQDRINEDFSAIIEDSGLDYRVIMMSRYGDIDTSVGDSDYPICISSPLGGHDCSDPIGQGVEDSHNPDKFYHFSTDVRSRDSLCRIIEGFDNPDELASDSRTWTSVAPNGLQDLLREDAYKSFVVITDDDVDCNFPSGYDFDDNNSVSDGEDVADDFDAALLALSPAQFGTASDRNYVFHSIVAMAEYSTPEDPWPATEAVQTGTCSPGSDGPGTGYQALSVLTGGLRYPTCRNDDFDAIFQALAEEVITGAEVSCEFALNNEGNYDPDGATVTFEDGDGNQTVLSQVDSEDDCDSDSWYYPDPDDPDSVSLCADTCAAVQDDPDARISVEVACASADQFEPESWTEIYTHNCGDDQQPQWGFFGYNTSTPSDSSVVFEVRTADTEADLSAASYVTLATAQASDSSETCALTGPSPCPVDLYTELGGVPAAHDEFLELRITANPSSNQLTGPTISNWLLTFSCPDAQ